MIDTAIPAIVDLAALGPRFVCWRWETRNGKPTKPPVRPAGDYADSTDPATWCSLDDAISGAHLPGMEGVGFVLDASRDGIIGIDLDGCRDPETGKIAPWAMRIIKAVRSYTEISPSGTGVKILFRADPVPTFAANKAVIHKANGTGKDQAVEIYTRGRYFCLTGQTLPDAPDEIVEATEAAEKLAHWLAKKAGAKIAKSGGADLPGPFLALLERDDRLRNAWDNGTKLGGGGDTSASALDWSLAQYLRQHLDDGEIAAVLRHHLHGQIGGGKLRGAAAERRIEKLLAELPIRRLKANGHDRAAAPMVDEVAAWPEPLDVIGAPELVGWPELTDACLPPALFGYVMAEAERLNVDRCPLAAHVIAACAASISDALAIRPKRHDPWTQQARIWSCVVKDVGARGTEMIRTAFWPLKERDAELFKAWRHEHIIWKGGQDSTPKGGVRPADPEPKCRRLVTNDATVEAVSEILKDGDEHAKLTILCDELVTFLGGFGRYTDRGASNRALMLEAYDGGPQRVDRIRRGHVYVPNWSVIVAGNIQPRRLAGMADSLIDDGLFQRFLTIHTRPAQLGRDDDRAIDPGVGRAYRELHEALSALQPVIGAEGKPMPCYCDDNGHAERARFMRLVERLQVDPTLPFIIRETAPKWSGLLARLTLVFHLVTIAEMQLDGVLIADRDLCQVSGPTVTMAAAFLRRVALPNLFRLGFETLPEEGAPAAHSRWLAGHILAHKASEITARDIGRAYRPLRGKPLEIASVMAVLTDAGWAVPAEGRADGQRWEVNPAVHQCFAAAAAQEKGRRAGVAEAIRVRVSEL